MTCSPAPARTASCGFGCRGARVNRPDGAPGTSWQRCRTHYLWNLLTQVPKSQARWVATMARTIFDQLDAVEVAAQFDRIVTALETKLPKAAAHLAQARETCSKFIAFPPEGWGQSGSTAR